MTQPCPLPFRDRLSHAFDEFVSTQDVSPRYYARHPAYYVEDFTNWLCGDARHAPLVTYIVDTSSLCTAYELFHHFIAHGYDQRGDEVYSAVDAAYKTFIDAHGLRADGNCRKFLMSLRRSTGLRKKHALMWAVRKTRDTDCLIAELLLPVE